MIVTFFKEPIRAKDPFYRRYTVTPYNLLLLLTVKFGETILSIT